MISRRLLTVGIVNIFAVIQLTTIRTYFAIFLEYDLKTDILIISALLTFQNLSQIFLRIPLANLSQIIGRKPLILMGTISYTASLLFLAIAKHWGFAFLSVLMIAIGMSAYWPSIFALLGDIAEPGDKIGEMNGRVFQLGDVGSLIAAGTASYLLSPNKLVGQLNIAQLFSLFCVIGAITNVIIYFLIKETLEDKNRLLVANKLSTFFNSIKNVLQNFINTSKIPNLFPIYLVQFALAFTEFGFGSFYPLLLSNYFHYLDEEIAKIVLYVTLLLLLVKPKLGGISDKFGYKLPVSLSFLFIAINIFGLISFDFFLANLIFIALIISTFPLGYSAMNSHTVHTAPENKRGIAMGTLGVYTSLGRGFSTLIIGFIASKLDLLTAFKFFSVFVFLFGVSLLIYFKKK